MSQISISQSGQALGVQGQLADNGEHDIVSGFSEEASAEIPFGHGVCFGTGDDGVVLPVNGSSKLRGIAIYSFDQAPGTGGNLGTTGLEPDAPVQVLRKGRVLVLVTEAVSVGDRGFCRHDAADSGYGKGSWRKSADNSEMIDASAQTVFVTSAAKDGLAVLEVDFTNKP